MIILRDIIDYIKIVSKHYKTASLTKLHVAGVMYSVFAIKIYVCFIY